MLATSGFIPAHSAFPFFRICRPVQFLGSLGSCGSRLRTKISAHGECACLDSEARSAHRCAPDLVPPIQINHARESKLPAPRFPRRAPRRRTQSHASIDVTWGGQPCTIVALTISLDWSADSPGRRRFECFGERFFERSSFVKT